jgi:hypothetical protein
VSSVGARLLAVYGGMLTLAVDTVKWRLIAHQTSHVETNRLQQERARLVPYSGSYGQKIVHFLILLVVVVVGAVKCCKSSDGHNSFAFEASALRITFLESSRSGMTMSPYDFLNSKPLWRNGDF